MKILLGVTGGIAAYKAAELLRLLQQSAVDVHVAMTRSAQRFVTPLTFAALTGHPVHTSIWQPNNGNPDASFEIEHITAGQGIDALVIAPATASILAKFAHGLADDFLTTLYLATTAPVLLAPAMNVNMWNHPATQANLRTLTERGNRFVQPDAGYLACGMTGSGRLASVDTIATEVLRLLHHHKNRSSDLAGETILITAGGTREPLDPVRFLGNRSSGKMGHALAESAIARGASVILVTASQLPAPASAEVLRVSTAAEMEHAVLAQLPRATIVIKAAAVADYRPKAIAATKLPRAGNLTLELEPTEDIVAKIVEQRRPGTIVVAFAAESESNPEALEIRARAKLLRKGADAIVANDILAPGLGFDADANSGLFLTADCTIPLPPATKHWMAESILDETRTLKALLSAPAALETS
jgi:phosphopantothenoylcysteine decarboxylase/phosphopantothenate--cysteine ligase